MNRKRLTVILGAIAAVIVLGLLAFILFRPGTGSNTTAEQVGGRKILYWRDPMDPTMRSDKPGKSPMGMEMVPVYEGEEGGGVKIDPTTRQNIGVRYETVERRTLTKQIRTTGRVDYDERRLFYINTKISGWVDRLYVNYTGMYVKKGAPLLDIYSPELVAAEEDYILALKYRDSAGLGGEQNELFRRTHQKLMFWDIPHEDIVRLEQTRQAKKNMTLVAPTSGLVIEKNVLQGGSIQAGTNLFKIADLSTVWVYADIYEHEVPFVRIGQQATITLTYAPGQMFQGRVSYIFPYVNPDTRTVRVRIEIPNRGGILKPDMFAAVDLKSPVRIDAVAIPEQSVIRSGERNVVVVARGDGHFESRDVKLGPLVNGFYQVLDGVKEGEQIVVSSQFLIDSESNLQAALQQMVPRTDSLQADSTSMQQRVPGKEPIPGMDMGQTAPAKKNTAPKVPRAKAPTEKKDSMPGMNMDDMPGMEMPDTSAVHHSGHGM